MNKKILILGAGIMQIPIIKKGIQMGYEVIVADYDKNAPGLKYADKFYIVSTLDREGILEIARKEGISGILTTSDAPVRVVSYVGKVLGLPSMSEWTSKICTDKYEQRSFLKSKGLNTPDFFLCTENTDFNTFTKFPYIVKPVDSSASRGVKEVFNTQELIIAAKEALAFSHKGQIIVESFISGREFSVETLTQNNKTHIIAITEKLTAGDDGFFVEDTHIQPARLNAPEKQMIIDEILKAVEAIGLDNCPTHSEIKINSEGAHIIEIACRLGGDYITSDLVPLSTGVDMLENLINLSVGMPVNTYKTLNKASCVQFLNTQNYNKCIDYINERSSEIVRYEVSAYNDKPIRNSMDRLGYIILQRDNVKLIENELNRIQ